MNKNLNPNNLVEGEDFYFEGELIVFTEKYHLKKGYCCNNNCRHCPYKTKHSGKPEDGKKDGGLRRN